MEVIQDNPCKNVHCKNGGVCQAVRSSDTKSYHSKCICPTNQAGLECERPNLCLNFCQNGGSCVSDHEGQVSCICPPGLGGSRCHLSSHYEYKDDVEEANSIVAQILIGVFSVLAFVALVFGVFYVYKRTRLGAAFKHRRMAENLLSNNAEFANQIYLQEEDDVGGDGIPMSVSTHFSNPVYESMYNEEANEADEDGGVTAGLLADPSNDHHQHQHHGQHGGRHHGGGHHSEHHLIEEHQDEESVDLLTEKHRGNISL